MFLLAILIGVYAYSIFFLGIMGLLYNSVIAIFTVLYWSLFYLWIWSKHFTSWLISFFRHSSGSGNQDKPVPSSGFPIKSGMTEKAGFIRHFVLFQTNKLNLLLFALLFLQASVNLIGAFGPELAFDALWYHLTLPKIYLQEHAIRFIPGGLLYYSTMPKLTEMLYVVALALRDEILAKGIHFLFGILSSIALHKIARKFFSQAIAVIAVVIFYANLVVAWESITAYIDLARTFYEVMALWAFLLWTEQKKREYLVLTGVMVGLAISTKLLALGSLVIFSVLIIWYLIKHKKPLYELSYSGGLFIVTALLVSSPWFIFSYLATGNPVYPLFSGYDASISSSLLSPVRMIRDVGEIFLRASDPISPLYLIFLPLMIVFYKHFPKALHLICFYSLLALLVWYLTPRTGGGRFLLPYLPAFSLLTAAVINEFQKQRQYTSLYRFSVGLVLAVAIISIGYRWVANAKYIPVLLGQETKGQFLTKQLNFNYGDFYDTDGFFARTINSSDRVLLYGFHNLYYVNFPFVHESWVKKGDTFNYIAVKDSRLPQRFWYWDEIYYNPITNVRVYTVGGQEWVY